MDPQSPPPAAGDQPPAGALALAGSGEYTPAMRATDAALLATLGPGPARVVVCPLAAGREAPASPARWARMGVEHFTALGAQVDAAMILNREDAADPQWLPLLNAADFYYFSGGDPGHAAASLRDTPAWEVILRRHRAGAVLGGCSAGAMMLGGWMFTPPGRGQRGFQPGLGLLPQLITLPHFDQFGRWVTTQFVGWLIRSAPAGTTVAGIDEDTALVRLGPADGAPDAGIWEVQGRQTVTVFDGPAGTHRVYRAGERVPLPFA